MTDIKLTKESLGAALFDIRTTWCGDVHINDYPNIEFATLNPIYHAARLLHKHWDALEALDKAGDVATQGEWFTTREIVDIDYYDAVRVEGMHEDLALFCYVEQGGGWPHPNYSDNDAQFITKAANTRKAIKKLIGGA